MKKLEPSDFDEDMWTVLEHLDILRGYKITEEGLSFLTGMPLPRVHAAIVKLSGGEIEKENK